jgi:N-[(2S)-2-amino-2-carboxyethyl]-L-glutamate dehydrogenase
MSSFSIITGKTAHDVIHEDIVGCIRIVRDAYLAHDAGNTVNPSSVFLRFPNRPEARIIALPAHLAGDQQLSGIKWIASYPKNTNAGLPRASAVLILNECEHGRPFACLEGSVISAARTAASAVLAAEHLHKRKRIQSLGVAGTGVIARTIYLFLLKSGWEVETLYLYDTDRQSQLKFEQWAQEQDRCPRIVHAADLGALLPACELVVFATVASQPHVTDTRLFAHAPTVLHISLRDLAPEILLNANNIVDDPQHALTANTSLHLAEQKTGARDFLTGTIADVLRGRCTLDAAKPTVFSPFGLGILDLAVGRWVYDRAIATGKHHPLSEFFFEPSVHVA